MIVEIWYFKNPENFGFLWESDVKNGKYKIPKSTKELRETHNLLLTFLEELTPDNCFEIFNFWSIPKERMNLMKKYKIFLPKTSVIKRVLERKNLTHTSMSVGDMVYYPEESVLYICKNAGWKRIPNVINDEG
jgi:hypothetical protein